MMNYIDTIKTILQVAELNKLNTDEAHNALIALTVGIQAKGNKQAIKDGNFQPVIDSIIPR